MCPSLDMFRIHFISLLVSTKCTFLGGCRLYTTIIWYHVSIPNRFKKESLLFSFSDFNNVSYAFLAFPQFTAWPTKITGIRLGNSSDKTIVLFFGKIGH